MATAETAFEQTLEFDDRNIDWQPLWQAEPLLKDVEAYVYDVDHANRTVDILFKFAAHSNITLHRHLAPYCTFVVQGELRIYRSDNSLKEVRPVGSCVYSDALGEPHREGGGDQDVIAFFSNRNIRADGAVYDLLDDDLNSLKVLGMADFQAVLDGQQA